MTHTFQDLGLSPELLQGITKAGYTAPTPIQAQAIPVLLNGQDVLGQAQTGTGKTAAFGLPLLQNLDTSAVGVQALILTPTRELTNQVAEALFQYGHFLGVKVLPIVGGQSYTRQISRLQKGVHVVVGTPGRVLDLIRQGALRLNTVRYLVLDEADVMLDMGFVDDVETIMRETPAARQTALFSATLEGDIRNLSKRYMNNPVVVSIAADVRTVKQTEQRYYLLKEAQKLAALSRILEVEDIKSAVIFARTKVRSAELAGELVNRGYQAEAFHGDLTQLSREIILKRFRNGEFAFLVATDVVARGIDIQEISHVINFDIPLATEDYVHRIGRTGRAGREGVAITLVTPGEKRRLQNIERYIKQSIPAADLPTPDQIYAQRDHRFLNKLNEIMQNANLDGEFEQIEALIEAGYPIEVIAAAAIRLARADEQQAIEHIKTVHLDTEPDRRDARQPKFKGGKLNKKGYERDPKGREPGMIRFKMNIGRAHGIRPGDVVFTIASQSNIPGNAIGAIEIQNQYTFVDVHEKHATHVMQQMQSGRFKGHQTTLTQVN